MSLRTVLITGCSEGGIGAALAFAFVHTGQYHVFATARNTAKIPQALADDKAVTVLVLDVTSEESIFQAAEAVSEATNGKLDVLINNSGAAMMGQPALDTDLSVARAMFDVNFFGVIAVTKAFTSMVVKAKGTLVNNSSIAGEQPVMYGSIYASTKAALTMFGECMRLELAALDVRVITLVTGLVQSNVLPNQASVSIPDNSFYTAMAPFLTDLPDHLNKAMKAMPTDQYARQVVQAIESKASGRVFRGNMSSIFKNVMWWLPRWASDSMNLVQDPGQHKVKQAAAKWRESSLSK